MNLPFDSRFERRHLLGQHDRIALDDQADAGAQPDRVGYRRRVRERHERIVGLPVVVGQPAPRSLQKAERNVGVLRHPHRLQTALLGGACQLTGLNRVLRGENVNAVQHGSQRSTQRLITPPQIPPLDYVAP